MQFVSTFGNKAIGYECNRFNVCVCKSFLESSTLESYLREMLLCILIVMNKIGYINNNSVRL